MRNLSIVSVLFVLLLAPRMTVAENVAGADAMICSPVEATVCSIDAGCEIGVPSMWGIPEFVEIDLKTKKLSTTAASGSNRETPITSVDRGDGWIFLQGVEMGRAFSFVISEETGTLTVAVARKEITVSVFGACTPLSR